MVVVKSCKVGLVILLLSLTGCYYDAPIARTDMQPDFYPKSSDINTSSYIDSETGEEKVVYDLNGHWKVWLGYADAVAIVQIDNHFEGRTMVGGGCCSHVYEAQRLIIRGFVDGNLVHCEKRTAGNDWDVSVSEFSKDAEEFFCLGFPVRRFERLGPTEAYYPLMQ